jgi:hypothetical protein
MTPELSQAVYRIATGWWQKRKVYGHALELENFRQECAKKFLPKQYKLNPDKNLFNYITEHCRMLLQQHLRHTRTRERNHEAYRRKVLEAYRWQLLLRDDCRSVLGGECRHLRSDKSPPASGRWANSCGASSPAHSLSNFSKANTSSLMGCSTRSTTPTRKLK